MLKFARQALSCRDRKSRSWAWAGFAFCLFWPSWGLIQKFLGNLGVAIYLSAVALILWLLQRFVPRRWLQPEHEKSLLWVGALGVCGLMASFAVLYPLANSGLWGRGSDSDEALNLATRALLAGHFPYYQLTYLHNPISPLPGSLVLAIPFVLLGNGAYQNFFWIALLMLGAARQFGQRSAALLLTICALFSPFLLYAIIIGSDYIANTIFVLLFTVGLLQSCSPTQTNRQLPLLYAILLGVGLSSRANFLMIVPLIFATLAARTNARIAYRYLSLTLLVFLLVTLPFYWHDPQHFSPLHTANKLRRYDYMWPYVGLIVPALNALLALALAWRRDADLHAFARNCALTLLFPALIVVALDSFAFGRLSGRFASFGVFALGFGALACWPFIAVNKLEIDDQALRDAAAGAVK